MEVVARAATADDVEALTALAREAIAERAPMRGGPLWIAESARQEPIDEGFRQQLAAADADVVVGCFDDVPLGYAALVRRDLAEGAPVGVVTDLYTTPEGRSVGIGEAMMDRLVTVAGERGYRGLDSVALPGDRSTKNFFESFGLVARAIVVHRPLGPGE